MTDLIVHFGKADGPLSSHSVPFVHLGQSQENCRFPNERMADAGNVVARFGWLIVGLSAAASRRFLKPVVQLSLIHRSSDWPGGFPGLSFRVGPVIA